MGAMKGCSCSVLPRGAPPSEIAFAQQAAMVRHMASDDEAEREHGERAAAGDALPGPRLRRQIAEEIDAGPPDVAELLDVSVPGTLIGCRSRHGDVLVEAGQRRVKAASEPQRTHDEDPFGIVHMAEDLAHAPLVRSIAMERAFLRDTPKEP